MKTARDDKQQADYIRYLRDCGYAQKDVAEVIGKHPAQVSRIAYRHDIDFNRNRRETPYQETGVYNLGLTMSDWEKVDADIQHWRDLLANDEETVAQMVAKMYDIPVGAVRCWMRGEEHRLD